MKNTNISGAGEGNEPRSGSDRYSKGLKRVAGAALIACAATLFSTGIAFADSEAGFIMVGGGESESGGVGMSGGESETGGVYWSGASSESGGPTDTGAESESGGALQSEAESESGGATNSGASSEATVGGGDSNWGRYVQYYGR